MSICSKLHRVLIEVTTQCQIWLLQQSGLMLTIHFSHARLLQHGEKQSLCVSDNFSVARLSGTDH